MGEIRFVGTGETRGYPYPVCKKNYSCTMKRFRSRLPFFFNFIINLGVKLILTKLLKYLSDE